METLEYIAGLIGDAIEQLGVATRYIMDSSATVIESLSWLPAELLALMVSAVTIIVVLKVVGR